MESRLLDSKLPFFCGLEEPAVRNIQLGMEGRIEIVKKLHGSFLLKFLFHRIAKRDFLILLELIFVRFKSPSFPLETSIYRQLMQCGIHLQFHITEIFLF